MTAQDDQNFYEHKERLLRYVRAGTATWAQKDWLKRGGFLDKPEPPKQVERPQLTKKQPKRAPVRKVYRYRGPIKVTQWPGSKE
jgi:hypothetical protein